MQLKSFKMQHKNARKHHNLMGYFGTLGWATLTVFVHVFIAEEVFEKSMQRLSSHSGWH